MIYTIRSWQQYEDLGKSSQEEIAGLEMGMSFNVFSRGEGKAKIAKQAGNREKQDEGAGQTGKPHTDSVDCRTV